MYKTCAYYTWTKNHKRNLYKHGYRLRPLLIRCVETSPPGHLKIRLVRPGLTFLGHHTLLIWQDQLNISSSSLLGNCNHHHKYYPTFGAFTPKCTWRHDDRNNETAAMLVYQDNPVGIELFSYVKTFFCSYNRLFTVSRWQPVTQSAWSRRSYEKIDDATWVNTLHCLLSLRMDAALPRAPRCGSLVLKLSLVLINVYGWKFVGFFLTG